MSDYRRVRWDVAVESFLAAKQLGIGAAFRQGHGVPSTGPPGIFLACRTTSSHRYWRYIETEDAENAYLALSVDRSRTVRSALGAIRRDLTNNTISSTTAAAK